MLIQIHPSWLIRRIAVALVLSLSGIGVVLSVLPAAALADASSVLVDLQNPASVVPGAQVSLSSATTQEQGWGYSGNMLRITMSPPAGRPLAGIISTTGAIAYTTTAAELPLWDTAVMEAAKHDVAAGDSIAGVEITRNYAGQLPESGPELLFDFTPPVAPPTPTGSMTDAQVQSSVRAGLPAWASSGTVTVVDDAAGERVVQFSISLPSVSLRSFSPDELLDEFLQAQQNLAVQGANIGRVTMMIDDAATGDPLYSAAGDSYLGFVSVWRSPLIEGFATAPSTSSAVSAAPGLPSAPAAPVSAGLP